MLGKLQLSVFSPDFVSKHTKSSGLKCSEQALVYAETLKSFLGSLLILEINTLEKKNRNKLLAADQVYQRCHETDFESSIFLKAIKFRLLITGKPMKR